MMRYLVFSVLLSGFQLFGMGKNPDLIAAKAAQAHLCTQSDYSYETQVQQATNFGRQAFAANAGREGAHVVAAINAQKRTEVALWKDRFDFVSQQVNKSIDVKVQQYTYDITNLSLSELSQKTNALYGELNSVKSQLDYAQQTFDLSLRQQLSPQAFIELRHARDIKAMMNIIEKYLPRDQLKDFYKQAMGLTVLDAQKVTCEKMIQVNNQLSFELEYAAKTYLTYLDNKTVNEILIEVKSLAASIDAATKNIARENIELQKYTNALNDLVKSKNTSERAKDYCGMYRERIANTQIRIIHRATELRKLEVQYQQAQKVLEQRQVQCLVQVVDLQKNLQVIDISKLSALDQKIAQAINATVQEHAESRHNLYDILTPQARDLLISMGIKPQAYEKMLGNALQKELVGQNNALINEITALSATQPNSIELKAHVATIVHSSPVAIETVLTGAPQEAIAATKWANVVYEITVGAIKGSASGVQGGAQNFAHVILHPSETLGNLAKVAFKFGEINAINFRSRVLGQDVSKEYAELGKNIHEASVALARVTDDYAKLPLPQQVEKGAKLVTGLVTEGMLFSAGLRATSKLGSLAKAKVLAVVGKTEEQVLVQAKILETAKLEQQAVQAVNQQAAAGVDAVSAEQKIIGEAVQAGRAILKNGYYEVNGFKFTEYYYNKLWENGRGAPSVTAQAILDNVITITPDPKGYSGFYKYVSDGWYMIYNPATKIISHLEPIK